MELFKTSKTFLRLENRQFNGSQIAQNIYKSQYIKNLPIDYISQGKLTKDDMIDRIEKMRNCGSLVEVAKYSDGAHIVRNANYCGILGCWHCGSRKEKQRYKRLEGKIRTAGEQRKYAYHIVFTIQDGENVRERSDFLRQSLIRWRKMGQRRKGKSDNGEYRKITEAIFSQEIVEGKNSRLFHTHCHAIMWTDEMIDFSVYEREQKNDLLKIYGLGKIPKKELDKIGKFYIEDIAGKKATSKIGREWYEATAGQGKSIFCSLIESKSDYQKALTEVIKYATKINENAPTRSAQIIADCHGLRFFSTAKGMRFNIKAGDVPPEPKQRTDRPTEILNFQWDRKENMYAEFMPSDPIIMDKQDKKRAEYLRLSAIELARYRKERNEMIKNPPPNIPLYEALDSLKAHIKTKIRAIWHRHDSISWIPFALDITKWNIQEAAFFGTFTLQNAAARPPDTPDPIEW